MSTIQQFNHSVDILRVVMWQYNDAENLIGLLQKKQTFYNEAQRDFWNNWFRDVFDLRTANEFGLSVWSNILDLPFFSELEQSPDNYPAFGFDTGSSTSPLQNFDNGNFASTSDTFINLDTEQKRLLLRLRYFQLTSDCTVPEINQFLNVLFGRDQVFLFDNLDMTIRYIFRVIPSSSVLAALEEFDILPRPSGVGVEVVIVALERWGFGEFRSNFFNGNFFGRERTSP